MIQELRTGGAERVVLSLTTAALSAGHEVAIAATGGDLEPPDRVFHYRLPLLARRPDRLPAAALALAGAVRSFRPDLLHAHNPGMGLLAGLVTARGRLVPGLTTLHGVAEADNRPASRLLRAAGLPVVACGERVGAAYASHGGSVLAVIPNGISPPPPAADRLSLTRQWGIDAGQPLLVCVGRLAPEKNQRLLIHALAHLPQGFAVLVGDGAAKPGLVELAQALGVADRVIFAGVRRDARSIMAAADLVVVPSLREGFPLAVIEAMQSGTPLIASAVGGIQELIRDGETAVVVPADDAAALAAAVSRLLVDPMLASRIAAAAAAEARTMNEDVMADSYLDLYSRLSFR